MVTMIGNTVQQMQIALNRSGATQALLTDPRMASDAENEAKKSLTIQTTKMLQELDASMKKVKDAPNLAAVLTHMAQTHAPGFEGTGLENLIKGAGFYQPGQLPQVQTGPSRIGTETRVPAEKK
jgi:predicted TIM-barrel fold metal-dependent hydrolase